MENTEKITQTIHKLLELSKNNPSQEEAQSAALKAQELLAKYHLDLKSVEDIDLDENEEIAENEVIIPAKKWKYTLATIIAENFRCKHFYKGKGTLVFFGHKTDTEVAADTFKYLFIIGNKLAGREVDKVFGETGTSAGVYNSFVSGFCSGVRDALGAQSKALMIVVPEDVTESYTERMKGCRHMNLSGLSVGFNSGCFNAYQRGKEEGRNALGRRQLEG